MLIHTLFDIIATLVRSKTKAIPFPVYTQYLGPFSESSHKKRYVTIQTSFSQRIMVAQYDNILQAVNVSFTVGGKVGIVTQSGYVGRQMSLA